MLSLESRCADLELSRDASAATQPLPHAPCHIAPFATQIGLQRAPATRARERVARKHLFFACKGLTLEE